MKELTPDQRRAQTKKKKYGADYFEKLGKKGGQNTPSKFNSESGKAAINARWERHRAAKPNSTKGEK